MVNKYTAPASLTVFCGYEGSSKSACKRKPRIIGETPAQNEDSLTLNLHAVYLCCWLSIATSLALPYTYTPTASGFPASNCLNTYCRIPPLA